MNARSPFSRKPSSLERREAEAVCDVVPDLRGTGLPLPLAGRG